MKYEDRGQLYKFLIDSKGFKVIEEKYYQKAFGNFYIILAGSGILIRYVNDRSILSIDISKDMAEPDWKDISLIKALIYKENTFDVISIEEKNSFLKKEIDTIIELFSDTNYQNTLKLLIDLGKLRFKTRILKQLRARTNTQNPSLRAWEVHGTTSGTSAK